MHYASDVTRTFPINGEWTMEARAIYDLVLDMQTSCEKLVAPGASWEELHLLAHKILVKGFLKLGIFKGGSEEEIHLQVSQTLPGQECHRPSGAELSIALPTGDIGLSLASIGIPDCQLNLDNGK
ncbi:hypothetical protein V1515DRAFT_582926 [Lipomyces mesembrius]